jgi:cell division protein ZapE
MPLHKIYQSRIDDGQLKPDAIQGRAVKVLGRLYDEIVAPKPKRRWFAKKAAPVRGVYMYGGVGRGKSMLMDLFYDALPDGITKSRVHFHAFMIEVHDYIHSRREHDGISEGVDMALPLFAARIAEHAKVLCFDEFHVTDVADAMILGRLFTALFERGVIVVATSNWEPDSLYKGGLQRDRFLPFIELLKARLEVVHLNSPTDYRTQFLMQEGSYFWPLGTETTRQLNAVFNLLTDNALPRPDEIKVKGRVIPVDVAAKGVGRFSFAQLCEQPHGAEDYLAIAARFHTVFLGGVPKLGYDRRNEAKRLMILVDALYEASVRLVVGAEALPDKLYQGHDHAFEFDRTISRLSEMQSADYISRG